MRILRKILHYITVPLAKHPEYIVFMYAVGIISAVCTVHYEWKQELYENAWGEVLLWVYASAALLARLPKKVCSVVMAVIYTIVYTVSIVDVYCFVKFESALNPSILMLIAETDTREAGEFLASYLSPDILLTNLSWVLLVPFAHIVWTIHRRVKRPAVLHKFEDYISTVNGMTRPVWGVLFLPLLIVSVCTSITNLSQLHTLMSFDTIGEVEHKLTEKDRGNQFLPLYRLVFSLYANNLTAKQIDIIHKVTETVEVDSCSFTSPEIVLIIGEAYNKHHSELYGYDRPTTPRQVAMKKEGSLVPFTDVVTPWNLTSFVFKHIMTTYTVGDKGDWCDYPLFGQLFRKAGYHVTFMTNEFLYQAKQEVFDFSGGFFLNDPVLSAAQFDARNTKLHVFDDGLLSDYKDIKYRRSLEGDTLQKGNLTIFHLIGQHQDYRIRCPRSKQHFKVEDYADRTDLVKPRWKKNLCNYDNATLYNDSIVSEITKLFKDKDAIVIYMPDHGEEVHSRELPHFSGRMHSTTIVKRLAREEFEIPFWIWSTEKYRQQHPGIWQQVQQAANRLFMTDALSHMLLYLGGIHCKYYRPDLNLLAPEYNAARPRIMKHQVDYDVLMGGGK